MKLRSVASLCLLALIVAAAPAAEARPMTVWDSALLRSVGSIAISPDGDHVAYLLSVPREPMADENGRAWAELHVYDREAGVSRAFVTGEVNVSSVKFSRDGNFLGYLAKRHDDEKSALYVIPLGGGESVRLLEHSEGIKEWAFGPRGARVAFLAVEEDSEQKKEWKEQGFDAKVYEEAAKPSRLFVVDVDLTAGTAEEPRMLEIDEHVADLQWAATGERLLVTLAPSSRIDDRYMKRQFATVDATSGEVLGRVQTEGKLGSASLSPDGERIAFVGPVDIHDPSAGRLMVASSDGGAPKTLLGVDFLGEVQSVKWIDRNELLVHADRGVYSFLARMSADGGDMKMIADDLDPVITRVALSADAKVVAATATSPSHPTELFVGRLGRALERVTDSNPWLAEIDLAPQRVVEWEARDGLKLEGILTEPLNREEGQRYPLIVIVHGGPEAHELNGWKTNYSRPGQFAAAQGFAVFQPNYRGSTGRGHEFSVLSQGDPGGKEFDDVVDGVDHLIEIGLVDPDRVGITGGSYGGYASAWGATYFSERYAAAVMFVGISEQLSKFGTTDIPRESQLVHQNPEKVYDNWQFFLERSPIYHARGSKTPLLILHGEDDPRVHPTQSMIMYRYYKHLADAPVRLVWYPGEGHGNRKAAGRLDYSLRLMRWMQHYLVDDGDEMPEFEIDFEEAIENLKG